MNSNELLKELYNVLKTSGWLDKATMYMQEHPERFDDRVYSNGKIASVNMSVSYQPESLSAVATVKPSVFISIGSSMLTDEREFNVYDTNRVRSCTWIDNKLVINDVKDIDEERTNV